MPARPVLRALGLGASFAAVVLACSLDWAVRLDDVDASRPEDGGPEDNTPQDGSIDAEREDAPANDADATITVECVALYDQLDAALKNARQCVTLGVSECQQTVKDVCDCDVVVRQVGSSQAKDYEKTVAKLRDSGCPTGCTGALCPSTNGRGCLSKPSGFECYPP